MTLVSAIERMPSDEVLANWKPRTVLCVTAGAVKVAVPVELVLSATVGPLVCVQPVLLAVPLVTVPTKVTVLPLVVLVASPAVTVVARRVSSLSQPASIAPPNTAMLIADRPPRSVWRRE